MQPRGPKAHPALAAFLRKAQEHTLRAYLETIVGALSQRAAQTKSGVDDIAIVVIMVLMDRLFPQEKPPAPVGQGNEEPLA